MVRGGYFPAGDVEEIAFEGGLRFAHLDEAGRRICATSAWISASDSGVAFSRIDLRLVLDRDEFVQPAFAHEDAVVEDADAVADFLHLPEQMRAEQDGDAARF